MSSYLFIGQNQQRPQAFHLPDGCLEGNPKALSLMSENWAVGVRPKKCIKEVKSPDRKSCACVRECVNTTVCGTVYGERACVCPCVQFRLWLRETKDLESQLSNNIYRAPGKGMVTAASLKQHLHHLQPEGPCQDVRLGQKPTTKCEIP